MSNKLGRRPRRGRNHSGPNFIRLFRYALDSAAYISLSSPARSALIEVVRAYNGANNGKIVLSERQFAERMGCDRKTVRKALHELIEKGFIEPRVKGAFSVKFRRATEWRLNDRRCDASGIEQSQAFLRWQNPDPNAQTKSKSRGEKLPPYRGKNSPTRNFSDQQERGENFPHYEKIHGGKNSPTSISTRAMAPNGACGWSVEASQAEADGTVADPPAHALIGHNAGPPLDQDDLSIPAFLRRTNLH
jgi:hypothetical protein